MNFRGPGHTYLWRPLPLSPRSVIVCDSFCFLSRSRKSILKYGLQTRRPELRPHGVSAAQRNKCLRLICVLNRGIYYISITFQNGFLSVVRNKRKNSSGLNLGKQQLATGRDNVPKYRIHYSPLIAGWEVGWFNPMVVFTRIFWSPISSYSLVQPVRTCRRDNRSW